MAKKYKISKLKIVKPIGYSDGAGNEVTTGALNITPEPGYSVVAGDFSITKLPPQIESVVFTNTSTVVTSHGDADNKVVATFTFKKDFVVTEGNIKILLPIKGIARRLSRASKQTTSWEFNVSRKHSAANYGWGVYPLLTTRKLTSLETSDVLSTTRPDYKESIIKGYGDPNEKEQALWFYMQPSAGYKFAKKPYLKITNPVGSKIKIHIENSSEAAVGYPKVFSAVLYITAKEDVNITEGVDIEFVCETIAEKVETRVINAISVGSDRVGTLGGTKTISINATRGSEFKVVATRRSTGKSTLVGTNSTYADPIYGSTPAKLIHCERNGVYSVKMKIPPSVILVTKMNGAISGASTLTLDSVNGVMKDDKITTLDKTQIDSATLRKVLSVNTSTKQVTLDGNVSILDDKKVVFTRSDKYDVNVVPSEFTQTVFSSNIPEKQVGEDGREYLYTINQDNPPTLSFTWSIGGLGGTITLPSTVTAVGKINATARDSRITSSDAMVNTNELGQFRINVIFKIAAPSGFGTPSQPLFSNTDSAASHWTNSLPSSNGGTEVVLFNIQASRSTTSTTNDTISMTIYGQIKKWGNADVAMDFDLDQITGIYTP